MNLNERWALLRFVDTMSLLCVSWQFLVCLNELLKVGQIQPSGAELDSVLVNPSQKFLGYAPCFIFFCDFQIIF